MRCACEHSQNVLAPPFYHFSLLLDILRLFHGSHVTVLHGFSIDRVYRVAGITLETTYKMNAFKVLFTLCLIRALVY